MCIVSNCLRLESYRSQSEALMNRNTNNENVNQVSKLDSGSSLSSSLRVVGEPTVNGIVPASTQPIQVVSSSTASTTKTVSSSDLNPTESIVSITAAAVNPQEACDCPEQTTTTIYPPTPAKIEEDPVELMGRLREQTTTTIYPPTPA